MRPGQHMLPPLPYTYDALEPYISERTMRLHHDVHHRAYVDGLNRAEMALARARRNRDWTALTYWERKLAFNGSGHFLHSIFWTNMSPNGGGRPTDEALTHQIERDFGSFDGFRAHFTEAANEVEGSGWALLVWQPIGEKLEILQTEQHQYFTQWTTIPILVLDVWEHAYYLQYQIRRPDYIESWWNVVNWPGVARRLREARKAVVSGGVANDRRAPDGPQIPDEGDGSNGADDGDVVDRADDVGGSEPNGGANESGAANGSNDTDDVRPPAADETDESGGVNGTEPTGGTDDSDERPGHRGPFHDNGPSEETGRRDDTGGSFHDVYDNDSYMVDEEPSDVKTLYGTRATIRRAIRGGAIKGGTPTRGGTVRYVYGRRSPLQR